MQKLPYFTRSETYPSPTGSPTDSAEEAGKEDDIAVGLVYFGARYYQPNLGRWMSADPMTVHALSSSLNPYSYVENAPVNGVDAYGLDDGENIDIEDPNSQVGNMGPGGEVVTDDTGNETSADGKTTSRTLTEVGLPAPPTEVDASFLTGPNRDATGAGQSFGLGLASGALDLVSHSPIVPVLGAP
ncbi:MAG: RHS repeat-associated core domain-containing protein [Polyangiaceae bacterium]